MFEKAQQMFGQPSKPPISIDAEMVTEISCVLQCVFSC